MIDAIPVLGSWIDPLLSFAPALRKTTAQVREEARRNFAALQGNGFGLPMQVRAWQSRVESSILPGTEVLSSAAVGPKVVMRNLNLAQVDSCRVLLGVAPGLLPDSEL